MKCSADPTVFVPSTCSSKLTTSSYMPTHEAIMTHNVSEYTVLLCNLSFTFLWLLNWHTGYWTGTMKKKKNYRLSSSRTLCYLWAEQCTCDTWQKTMLFAFCKQHGLSGLCTALISMCTWPLTLHPSYVGGEKWPGINSLHMHKHSLCSIYIRIIKRCSCLPVELPSTLWSRG